jgi:hypothetical protein
MVVSTMHEEVHRRTQQENQIRQYTEQMCAVFGPEKEPRRHEKYKKRAPVD